MKNNIVLNLHCIFSLFFGILLLINSGISYIALFFNHMNYTLTIGAAFGLFNIFLLSLFLIGVSQFLIHVSDQTERPGWLLRRGEYIIYFAIIVTILQVVWSLSTLGPDCLSGVCSLLPARQEQFFSMIFSAIMVFVKLLIMFGIAQSLRAMGYTSAKKSVD